MGRPSTYTDAIAQEICDRLACGEGVNEITQDDHMPGERTVYGWMASNEDFRSRIARAREAQQDYEADNIVRMADEATEDNWLVVQLRIRARQWRASKLAPKRYGEATLLKHADADGNSLDLAGQMAAARARTEGH